MAMTADRQHDDGLIGTARRATCRKRGDDAWHALGMPDGHALAITYARDAYATFRPDGMAEYATCRI